MVASALSALDEAEGRALASHLEGCADCRAEMDEWQETAAWLALDVKRLEPSKEFRSQLLLKLKTDDPDRRLKKAEVVPLQPVRAGWATTQKWGAIAAGFVTLALLTTVFVLWRENRLVRRELATLTDQVQQTRAELAQQQEAASILTAPGARLMNLSGTEMAPAAHAMLAYDQTGRAILMAKSLPRPPAGKAYQLWFIAGGQKMPGKVFVPNPAGEGTLKDQVPAEAMRDAVFAITLEPENGVIVPTGEIYLVSGT